MSIPEALNPERLPVRVRSSTDIFDPENFEHAQRVAKVFSMSELVPAHMRTTANCLIGLQIARRLNEDPLTVMQNIYIINNRAGWHTSYLISRANKSGVFKSRITWSVKADQDSPHLAVTASAVLADSGELAEVTCDMRMAVAEGWTRNPKYKSMPIHMLRWRSAAMLIRLYVPEVMFGMSTYEELETMPPEIKDVTPQQHRSVSEALDQFAKDHPTPEPSASNTSPESNGATADGSAPISQSESKEEASA